MNTSTREGGAQEAAEQTRESPAPSARSWPMVGARDGYFGRCRERKPKATYSLPDRAAPVIRHANRPTLWLSDTHTARVPVFVRHACRPSAVPAAWQTSRLEPFVCRSHACQSTRAPAVAHAQLARDDSPCAALEPTAGGRLASCRQAMPAPCPDVDRWRACAARRCLVPPAGARRVLEPVSWRRSRAGSSGLDTSALD